MLEITPNLWQIITAVSLPIGLGFTVYQLYKTNQTRDLQLVEKAFYEIISTEERLFYVMERINLNGIGDGKLDPHEWAFLYNRIEYLCQLINHKYVKDKEMLQFFKNSIVRWYEYWFVKYLPEHIVNDELAFPAFKYRYNLYKIELLEKGEKQEEVRKIIRSVGEKRKKLEEEKMKVKDKENG